MEVPEILFATSGDLNLAYQRFGTGPDVVAIPAFVSNVELMWEHELWRRGLEFTAKHVRILHFDKRGIGISDRFEQPPTLEQRIDDIAAVMDAESIHRASILGLSEGGLMAQLFAARHPDRVEKLVLVNAVPGARFWAEFTQTDEGKARAEQIMDKIGRLVSTWGQEPQFIADWYMPSQRENPSFVRWLARYLRQTAGPADVRRQLDSLGGLDAADELGGIRAPTLVVHVAGDQVIPVEAGRYLAERIPGARYLEVQGSDHFWWVMPTWREALDPIVEFITGNTPGATVERRFGTVLFTDIVGSTEHSSAVGDDAWRTVLDSHDRIAWKVTDGHRGRIVKSTGDGLLALFDSPSDGVACAASLLRELSGVGVTIRAGLHSGEVIVREDGDITGVAVNLAARVEQAAADGTVLVSSTVRDLLLGGGFIFADEGERTLKGIEGAWRLYRLGG